MTNANAEGRCLPRCSKDRFTSVVQQGAVMRGHRVWWLIRFWTAALCEGESVCFYLLQKQTENKPSADSLRLLLIYEKSPHLLNLSR